MIEHHTWLPSAGPSVKRRLEAACGLTHALVERAFTGGAADDAEATWRRREALALIEESSLPTAVFGLAGQLPTLANAAWRELFGPGESLALAPAVARARAGRPPGSMLHVAELAVEAGGRPAYCAATFRSMRGASGTPAGVIAICAVTTDAVVVRELAVKADTLVWSAPLSGDPDYVNRRWCDYTGDLRGPASWQSAIEAGDLPRCTSALGEAARERVSTDVEARVRGADGGYRWHRIRFVVDASGARWFGTAIDIHEMRHVDTERSELVGRERAARGDAEQANRLKDQFLASVSHELRGPLTTMLLWEKVLRDATDDPALRDQALDAIHQSALSQSRIVGDLLDVSRAISGKLHVDLHPVDLYRILDEALAAIAPVARDKRVALARSGAPVVGEIQGDAARLRQVFENLLSNAVKFTESGGRVMVTVGRKARSVVIQVEDTGRGIAPDFLPRVFEPFSQTDDTLTRRESGLGLGLAIAKQLVELHRGTLSATSPGPGHGATLTVTLPVGTRRFPSPPVGIARTPALDRICVLVVDDDRRVRDALAHLLDRAGALVETVESAELARASVESHRPDVIVCDIAMPVEDGYRFIEQLRGSKKTIPAIALTAHATESDGERALTAGFDLHLAKPLDFDRLLVAIDRLTAARRAR